MLKGRTTIQLRNAKTGEIEQEVTEENLVTNAVQNMMSMPYFARVARGNGLVEYTGGADFERYIMMNNLPIYRHAYGGITIFKNAHEESVDKVLPDYTNEIIGYAGGEGTSEVEDDMRCGEFNITESKALDNGYHFVWDFDTEKSNGTFKSVSLGSYSKTMYSLNTSKGYSQILTSSFALTTNNVDYANSIKLPDFKIADPKLPEDTPTRRQQWIVKIEETFDKQFVDVYCVFFAASNTLMKMCIEKVRLRMPHVRALTQTAPFAEVKRETLLEWTTPPKYHVTPSPTMAQYFTAFLDGDDLINVIYRNSDNQASHFTHTVYGLDGKQISTVDVTAPANILYNSSNYSRNTPAVYRDGYYYSVFSGKIARYNAQGVEKDSVQVSTPIATSWYLYFDDTGYLVARREDSDVIYIQADDNGMSIVRMAPAYAPNILPIKCNISSVKQPWGLYMSFDNTNSLSIGPNPYYLATINNLEKSITKTDAQTMKIIYDLTEEEEE